MRMAAMRNSLRGSEGPKMVWLNGGWKEMSKNHLMSTVGGCFTLVCHEATGNHLVRDI